MKINLETQKLSELSPEEALKSNQAAVSFQFNDHKQNSKNGKKKCRVPRGGNWGTGKDEVGGWD